MQPYALPALDDQWADIAQRGEVGVGVNKGFDVAGGEIAEHGGVPWDWTLQAEHKYHVYQRLSMQSTHGLAS